MARERKPHEWWFEGESPEYIARVREIAATLRTTPETRRALRRITSGLRRPGPDRTEDPAASAGG